MKRYWRRSSRWRAALARTNPEKLGWHRLQILARNENPFGGWVRTQRLLWIESSRISLDIYYNALRSPWVDLIELNKTFPKNAGNCISKLVFAK